MNKGKTYMTIFIIVFVLIIILGSVYNVLRKDRDIPMPKPSEDPVEVNYDNPFALKMIQQVHKESNYLISPYSMEIALNMLKDGADGNTKEEIEKVVGTREIPIVGSSDEIKIANALFMTNRYKDRTLASYYDTIKTSYDGEILYDEFKTPDVINNWVKEKTNGMIPKILDSMNPNFAFGIANALAMDAKWQDEFECDNTQSATFTKLDGNDISVEMMHQTYESNSYRFIKEDGLEGVILPYGKDYESKNRLEFVALMPNDINAYIRALTNETINEIDSKAQTVSNSKRLSLALPRFSYAYDLKSFKDDLIALGINDAFDDVMADFTNAIPRDKQDGNIFVGEAIHKTKIELNETGTKAAAVTYFGMFDKAAFFEEEYEIVNITFNKPFIYMIRDQHSKEIVFFGAVYEPSLWQGTTCK